jgi:hypothetical protein
LTVVAAHAAQAVLVEQAKALTVGQVRIRAKRLVDAVDPADADRVRAERLAEQERRGYDTATLRVRKGLDGVAHFSGTTPHQTAEMLLANLDAITDPRRDHLNEQSPEVDERVPYEARIGRALCELIESFQPPQLPRDRAKATLVVAIQDDDLRQRAAAAGLPAGEEVSAGSCGGSPAEPGSSPPCSAETPGSSTSGTRSACSRRRSASPSPSETGAACSPAAIGRRAGPRPTTSNTGQTAGQPTWETPPCSAGTTTDSSTEPRSTATKPGKYTSPKTACWKSRLRDE